MSIGLHHLRYFVAVAEEGHVTRAAQRLRIAQPSLSAQIRYLERQVGAPLFRRHPRGVELTPAGEAFLAEARAALVAADAAVAAARRATRPSHLRLGLIVGTQIEVTSTVLYAYRSRHDGVVLDLVEHSFADPSAGLNGGEVDVAFVMPPFAHQGLRFETLWSAPRVAVLPTGHPLAGRAAVSVRELFDEPWIVADTDDQVCRDWWLAAGHRTAPPKLGQRTRSIDKFIQLVAAREVVGLAADWVAPIFARPGIAFVPVSDVEPATTAVAWRPGSPNPLVDGFVALAREIRDALGLATHLHRRATGRPPGSP
jgi:DNA-binding transcriptional LysR family regulator